MTKPIFIMIIPGNQNCSGITSFIEKKLYDYHCLFLYDGNKEEFEFKVFSDKEIKPIKLEELKKTLKNKLL